MCIKCINNRKIVNKSGKAYLPAATSGLVKVCFQLDLCICSKSFGAKLNSLQNTNFYESFYKIWHWLDIETPWFLIPDECVFTLKCLEYLLNPYFCQDMISKNCSVLYRKEFISPVSGLRSYVQLGHASRQTKRPPKKY